MHAILTPLGEEERKVLDEMAELVVVHGELLPPGLDSRRAELVRNIRIRGREFGLTDRDIIRGILKGVADNLARSKRPGCGCTTCEAKKAGG